METQNTSNTNQSPNINDQHDDELLVFIKYRQKYLQDTKLIFAIAFVLTLGTVMFISPQQIFLRPHRIC